MRILLVEDDLSLGEGIRTALRRAAYSVDWVQDGAAALAAIGDGEIDLVMLDLGLPRMDGLEVIRRTRQLGADVPILVLSARERPADRALGLDVGADDYLGKPFDTTELLARTRALLRRSAGRATPQLEIGALHLEPARLAVGGGGPGVAGGGDDRTEAAGLGRPVARRRQRIATDRQRRRHHHRQRRCLLA